MSDSASGRRRPRGRDEDDRPPICPACGVTMGIVVGANGWTTYICQECGYPDGNGGDDG